MRIAVLFHRFGPYHCARLAAASRYCELLAIEAAAETNEYAWSRVDSAGGYRRVTLFPTGDSRKLRARKIESKLDAVLTEWKPDAVAIPGWSDNAALAALHWCVKNGVPSILMSESTAHDERRVWWKESVKQRLVRCFSAALVGGQQHADYLAGLGMPPDRIFSGYDVVDNDHFVRGADKVRSQKEEVRKKYHLPENYFLASARFLPKKNLPGLIRAYGKYRDKAQHDLWDLVLLGDGRLFFDISNLIGGLRLKDSVHLSGFIQYDELSIYYGLANAFVHASSTEQWGLVVNEAIASGLPVIVSNRCGCAPELVRDNGFTFDPANELELAGRMQELASMSPQQLLRLGETSRRIATEFDLVRFGEGLEKAARAAIAAPNDSAGFVDKLFVTALSAL